MTTIFVPSEKGRILFANEYQEGGNRYMRVRRIRSDGTTYGAVHQVDDVGPLLMIGGLGDVDDIALRDLVQELKATPPPIREDKPDITKLYLEFQEDRLAELSGRRTHAMWPRKDR